MMTDDALMGYPVASASDLTPDHWRTLTDALGGEDLHEAFQDLGMN